MSALNGFNHRLRQIEAEMGARGRVFVRYSGTEPLLRIMVEGPDQAGIRARADELAALIRKEKV